ncbi:MAG TPA: flagellar biosynthetic protein FliO, partial [Candidatus Binatia bacterium]|nr:flagellar biosynthetic protein FliO [Candidatus Binatia bacterium]
ILLIGMAPAASAASLLSTNLPPVSPVLPEVGFSVIRLFGALTLVLGLFLSGVWLFKNWPRLTRQRGRPAQLQVVEMRALGGKHVLYVVGYQQQRLLLASSPAGVMLLSHLPAADAVDLQPAQISSQNFVQALQQAVQGPP